MARYWDFTRENNFVDLFARVRIINHFPLKCPVAYFTEITIQMTGKGIGTMKKRDVSYAKRLAVIDRPSDRSFM